MTESRHIVLSILNKLKNVSLDVKGIEYRKSTIVLGSGTHTYFDGLDTRRVCEVEEKERED